MPNMIMSVGDLVHCRVEREGPILRHDPASRGAQRAASGGPDLQRVFDHYAADRDLHVAILTGCGERAFCVGTDLKALAQTDDHRIRRLRRHHHAHGPGTSR